MVDVTATLKEAGRLPHGTIRVERGIVNALVALNSEAIAFCRFDRIRQRFIVVDRLDVLNALARPTFAEKGRSAPKSETTVRVKRTGKRFEAMVREYVRAPILRQLHALESRIWIWKFPPGTTFLSVGEIRFDLGVFSEIARRSSVEFVSTIFDVLPMAAARRKDQSQNDRATADFDTIFRLSSLCLCISETTKQDVEEYAQIRGLRCPDCAVIPLAQDLPAAPRDKPAGLNVSAGDYVLTVGTITARKNQRILVDVWREFVKKGIHPECKLVIVGAIAQDSHAFINEIRGEPDLASRVLVFENADDSALAWLYRNCRFTAFPSFLEGFGLPVAESLSMGKLCVASSASAIPEAAQGQAILLSPNDQQSWQSTITRLLDDVELVRSAELRIAGGYRRQTWSDTADRILELINSRSSK